MRVLPAALQSQLDTGASTLCRCWRLTRADGLVIGVTDHDAPLTVDGLVYEPGAGFTSTAYDASDGLDIDNTEIAGALTSEAIDDTDIDRGLFDGADIEFLLVDWSAPDTEFVLFVGTLGEIRRRGHAFEAELRGLSDKLSEPRGRQLLPTCDAALGDARCGVDLENPTFRLDATVASVEAPNRFRVSGADGVAAGWFAHGQALMMLAGAARGLTIVRHTRESMSGALGDLIVLDADPIDPITVGSAVTLVAGCDKRWETCRDKFANQLRFRGFPHVPSDDWIFLYPQAGGPHDGGSRNG